MAEALTEHEIHLIYKLFPSDKELWDTAKDLNPMQIPTGKEYAYFASLCLSDFVDLMQTTSSASFKAIRKYILQRRLKINKNWEIASIFYFRQYFDYALISLISALNNLTAFYCYQLGKFDKPLEKYPTLDQVNGREFKALDFPIDLLNLQAHKNYILVKEYRHALIHRGLPKIKGEFRKTRRNPVTEEGFHNGVIGLVKRPDSGYTFYSHQDPHQYTIFSLLRSASWLYKTLLREGFVACSKMKPEIVSSLNINEII